MRGKPLPPASGSCPSPGDAPRCQETPRDVETRRHETPRDATRCHETPRDASRRLRDAIFKLILLIFSNFRLILGLLGPHVSMRFLDTSFALFLWLFFHKFQKKIEKVKSAQNTAPVHRFRGSPGCKKSEEPSEKTLTISSMFHQKSIKTRAQK